MQKQFTEQQILDMIPGSWSEVTLDFYINKLMTINSLVTTNSEEDTMLILEQSIDIATHFIGLSKEIVSEFPMQTITKIHRKLSFLQSKPKPLKKTKFKWITKLEDPTYDTYITYIKVSEQLSKGDFSGFPLIVKSICLDNLSDEDIMKLPMDEVETGFFLLRKSLRKYLQPTIDTLKTQLMIERIKVRLSRINHPQMKWPKT